MMTLTDLFLGVSTVQFAVIAFGLGVIIGSFLNVYIYRFHTGKSLSGSSHCLSCGAPLAWYDLFPLLSYLGLRGRCRQCGCKIPARYFLVELMTGLLFAGALSITTDVLALCILWFIFSVMVVITVYDYYHFIIPDSLTLTLLAAVSALVGYQWFISDGSLVEIAVAIAGALAGSAFFLALWLISKGAWLGFGDVKLAVPLGLLVGATQVFSFVVLSFWIGAGVSLFILGLAWLLERGKQHLQLPELGLTMKSAVPFAPFMVASSLVIIFTHFNALALFSFF
jgi:leader peptidase (prepilin peptidase)/N-methyltransferase